MNDALLIENSAVRGRMAIGDDILGVDPVIESAISASQLRVQTELGSGLQKKEHSDTFFLDSDLFAGINPGGVFRLLLRSGLVREEIPVAITSGRSWNDANDLVDLASRSVRIDYVKGLIYLDMQLFANQYVTVTYTSGYEQGEDIPDWLSEAILAYVPVVFNFGQPTNRSDEAEKVARMSGDHAMAILSGYQRNIGFVYRPVM